MFAVLGILVTVATLYSFPGFKTRIFFPLCISAGCSFADELLQICIPGRAFQWNDLGTDIIGAFVGCIFVYVFFAIVCKLKKK